MLGAIDLDAPRGAKRVRLDPDAAAEARAEADAKAVLERLRGAGIKPIDLTEPL